MSKTHYKALLRCYVCLIIVACGIALLGCGTVKRASKVTMLDFFGEVDMQLKIKVANLSYGGNCNYFDVSKTLEDLKLVANSMNDNESIFETEITNDVLLIKVTQVKLKRIACFAVQKLSSYSQRYVLSNMSAYVDIPNVSQISFLLPYQFCQSYLSEKTSRECIELLYKFIDGDELHTSYSWTYWKDFYTTFGQSEYVTNDDEKTIVYKKVKLTYLQPGIIRISAHGDGNFDANSIQKY